MRYSFYSGLVGWVGLSVLPALFTLSLLGEGGGCLSVCLSLLSLSFVDSRVREEGTGDIHGSLLNYFSFSVFFPLLFSIPVS